MSKLEAYADQYAQNPKLLSVYGHLCSYSIETCRSYAFYKCLYKTHQNGHWVELELDRNEISLFVPPEKEHQNIKAHLSETYSEYETLEMQLPLAQQALDSQLNKLVGVGFNCDWVAHSAPSYGYWGTVAYVHHKLKKIVFMSSDELGRALGKPIHVQNGYFQCGDESKGTKNTFSKTYFGFAKRNEALTDLAESILEYHSLESHYREKQL